MYHNFSHKSFFIAPITIPHKTVIEDADVILKNIFIHEKNDLKNLRILTTSETIKRLNSFQII